MIIIHLLLMDNRFDIVLSGISFNESVLGLARLGTMCSTIYSGGILMVSNIFTFSCVS